jgi:hypothetical protein
MAIKYTNIFNLALLNNGVLLLAWNKMPHLPNSLFLIMGQLIRKRLAPQKTLKKHLPLQDPWKFTQIGIFGLKICMPSGNPVLQATSNPFESSFGVKENKWNVVSFPR